MRFALLLGRLGPPPHVLEEPLARERALEPVQELRGRIDLIVVLPLREDGHLVKVFGEPYARNSRGGAGASLIEKIRFAADSPVEEARFEPSVPRKWDPRMPLDFAGPTPTRRRLRRT